jgi:hypothetical protein
MIADGPTVAAKGIFFKPNMVFVLMIVKPNTPIFFFSVIAVYPFLVIHVIDTINNT